MNCQAVFPAKRRGRSTSVRRAPVFADERTRRVERVEQEVRVELIAQHFQFGFTRGCVGTQLLLFLAL